MALLPFRKLHGLGNDFVLFDGCSAKLPVDRLTDPRSRHACAIATSASVPTGCSSCCHRSCPPPT